MGGYGSGRGNYWGRKRTVESCLRLDLAKAFKNPKIASGQRYSGSLSWTRNTQDENIATVSFTLNTLEEWEEYLNLRYTLRREGQEEPLEVDMEISLETTKPHFGGLRWWFQCPLVIQGHSCMRRVRTIFLPRHGNYFGCRHCYNLTYHSSQTHDARVDFMRKRLPEILANPKMLNSMPMNEVVLFFKAMR